MSRPGQSYVREVRVRCLLKMQFVSPGSLLVQFKECQWADGSRPGPRSPLPRLLPFNLQKPAEWAPCQWSAERKQRPVWSGAEQQEEAAGCRPHWRHEESQKSR